MRELRPALAAILCLIALSACSVSVPAPTATPAPVLLPAAPTSGAPVPTAPPASTQPAPTAPVAPPASATPTWVLSAPLPSLPPGIAALLTPQPVGTQTPAAQPAAATAARPALSGRIVLQTASGGDILAVNADGTGRAVLAAGLDPAWSPDGRQVAFAGWAEPQGIYVMDRDGSNRRLVYAINGAKSPTWSPDGTKIAFTWRYKLDRWEPPPALQKWLKPRVTDAWRVSVVNLATGNKTDLPLDPDGHAFSPQWGPDGRVVYKGVRGLWLTDEAGPPLRISDDPWHWTPVWSPDGSKIALALRRHDHWDIAVMNSNGSGLAYLTESPTTIFTTPTDNVAPAWSPDGKSIAFLSNREGGWRVFVMNADGAGRRKLLDTPITYDFAGERVLSWTK